MKYRIKSHLSDEEEGSPTPEGVTREGTKALRPYDEYGDTEIEILGVPFGGHLLDTSELAAEDIEGMTLADLQRLYGRDSYGEHFHEGTDIMMEEGEETRLTYYHGFGPDSPYDWQNPPVVIGRAKYSHRDENGFWFTARLDEGEELAQRIIVAYESGGPIRASSGAVGHMVRQTEDSLDVWPVGELAVFDTNEWRQPANDLAVITPKSMQTKAAEARAKAGEGPAEPTDQEIDELLNDEPAEIVPYGVEPRRGRNLARPSSNEGEIDMTFEEMQAYLDKALGGIRDEIRAGRQPATPAEPAAQREPEGGVLFTQAPAQKRVTNLGFTNEPMDAFAHYLRTGDNSVRAALQEDTDGEGGYLVPDDFYGTIIEKRDEASIARGAGATIIQTDLKVVNVPTENAKLANFAIVAEEGAANQNEPTFGQVPITVYKFNKLIKVSDELIADEKANLFPYLSKAFGRAMALTENNYFLVGTGSGQPQGAVVGSTLGVTAAGAAAITATEIMQLYYKLKEYRDNGVWTMQGDTEAALRSIQGNPFVFGQTPSATGLDVDTLQGKRVYNSASMPAMTTGLKSVLFGNWEYYAIVERAGMAVRRLSELYAANGQVGLLATFRVGGAVLQAEAFQHLIQA